MSKRISQVFFAIINGIIVVSPKNFDGEKHHLRAKNGFENGTKYPFTLNGRIYFLETPRDPASAIGPRIFATSSLCNDTFFGEGEVSLNGNDVKTANKALRQELKEEENHKRQMLWLARAQPEFHVRTGKR